MRMLAWDSLVQLDVHDARIERHRRGFTKRRFDRIRHHLRRRDASAQFQRSSGMDADLCLSRTCGSGRDSRRRCDGFEIGGVHDVIDVEDHAELSYAIKQSQLTEVIQGWQIDEKPINAAAAERLHDAADGLVFRLLRRTTTVGFRGLRFGGRAEFRKTTAIRAAHLRVETAAVVPSTRKVLIPK